MLGTHACAACQNGQNVLGKHRVQHSALHIPHTGQPEQLRAMMTPVPRLLPRVCLHSHKVCGGVLFPVQLLGNDLKICQVNVEQGF